MVYLSSLSLSLSLSCVLCCGLSLCPPSHGYPTFCSTVVGMCLLLGSCSRMLLHKPLGFLTSFAQLCPRTVDTSEQVSCKGIPSNVVV